jgi:hypothetical protein
VPDLIGKGILQQAEEGGRSANYKLIGFLANLA